MEPKSITSPTTPHQESGEDLSKSHKTVKKVSVVIELESNSQTADDPAKPKRTNQLKIDLFLRSSEEPNKATGSDSRVAGSARRPKQETQRNKGGLIGKQSKGHLAKSPFMPRIPPLWCYVHAKCTFIDSSSKVIYIQLEEDVEAVDLVTEEMKSSRRKQLGKEDSVSLNDLCENETLVSVIHTGTGDPARARVVKIDSVEKITLFYIDFGSTAQVTLQEVTLLMSRKALQTGQTVVACRFSADLDKAKTHETININDCLLLCLSSTGCHVNKKKSMKLYQIEDLLPRPTLFRPAWTQLPDGREPPIYDRGNFRRGNITEI